MTSASARMSWSGTRFKRSSTSIRARSRALRSIAPDVVLECSSSDDDEVSLAQRETCADFPEVTVQLLDPSEWRLAAYGAFFRDENIIILEARSFLYAVRYAESCYPPRRLLIFSDHLALVLSVMRRIFASRFRAGFVLSFRWIPSELSFADKEAASRTVTMTRAKSLLQVLAQRSPRFSPARTCDQDCLSLS